MHNDFLYIIIINRITAFHSPTCCLGQICSSFTILAIGHALEVEEMVKD